jgi:hypothetical protein
MVRASWRNKMMFHFYADEKYNPLVHCRPVMAGVDRNGRMCWDEPCHNIDSVDLEDHRGDVNYMKFANTKGKGV